MRVDTQKLRGKMAERGYTITALSKDVGVDRNTFSAYLKNPEKLTYGVLIKIANILFDSKEEAVSVFFADDLYDVCESHYCKVAGEVRGKSNEKGN